MKRLLPIFLLALGPSAFALDGFELRPNAQVTSAGVFLDEIASGINGAVPHLRVAAAPRPGQSLTVPRRQIEATLARMSEAASTNFSGALQVQVTRRTRLLEEDELRLLLSAQLQAGYIRDRGELELRFARPWTPVPIPDEPLKLKILDLPTSGVAPLFVCRFELAATNETTGPWQVSMQAKVWREIWTSRTALRRGTLLADADLIRERHDVLTLREAPADFAAPDPGLELGENVTAHAPLPARSLKVKPAVRRGQAVEALVVDGALAITMKVEALEDGIPGQLIRIRNPQTKRELKGKVQNEQTILVSL